LPVCEDQPLDPKNFYGASKVAGEAYCAAFQQRGLDVRTLRLSNVYGPRDTDRVIPLWLDRARQGLALEVYGGKQVLDFIWVDVVIEALLRVLDLDAMPEAVNVGSGKGTSITKLAERILSLSDGGSAIALCPARDEEVVRFVADTQRMRDVLGIVPPGDPLSHLRHLASRPAEAPA
jgi:UDP-glucose 4-epimerase